jgi:hypothetical protein
MFRALARLRRQTSATLQRKREASSTTRAQARA